MSEMIVPGTYITVRAEGLISAGGIATGVVGVVGTAASGPVNTMVTLSSFAQARDLFGPADDFDRPSDGAHPLTLIRALEQVYRNGATNVVAVRVGSSAQATAKLALQDGNGRTVAVLSALTPGTAGNQLRATVQPSDAPCRIEGEILTSGFDRLGYAPVLATAGNPPRIKIVRGLNRRVDTLNPVLRTVVTDETVVPDATTFTLRRTPIARASGVNSVRVVDDSGKVIRTYGDGAILYGSGGPPAADQIRIVETNGVITFEASQVPTNKQQVIATYGVDFDATKLVPGQVLVTTWDGGLQFAAGEAPSSADKDQLIASYLVAPSACVRVTVKSGPTGESWVVPDGKTLESATAGSKLIRVVADGTDGGKQPAVQDAYFGTGSNIAGNNGAEAGPDDYAAGLDELANKIVNIVVLAGQDARTMGSVLAGHLAATEQTEHERIGVIGASGARGAAVSDFLQDGDNLSGQERIVLVAPGIVKVNAQPPHTTLPPAYTAAAVAGLIASLDVQHSLTNKPLNVDDLAVSFNRGEQEQLIQKNVLALVKKNGLRVLKGVTTGGVGTPFSSISIRRIVDYAKYGVRAAANPYIGRLNNARVRAALKATLDSFLTGMVEDEALTAYTLEVSATRAQEIAGEVNVVMTVQPTFSIDFVQVTMVLK